MACRPRRACESRGTTRRHPGSGRARHVRVHRAGRSRRAPGQAAAHPVGSPRPGAPTARSVAAHATSAARAGCRPRPGKTARARAIAMPATGRPCTRVAADRDPGATARSSGCRRRPARPSHSDLQRSCSARRASTGSVAPAGKERGRCEGARPLPERPASGRNAAGQRSHPAARGGSLD